MKVTILGCGSSAGVPLVGEDWGACDPSNPRNRRRRASILVEEGGRVVLIDTSPDLREQLLGARTGRIDAVLFTHAHADHLHGIDDLRPVNRLMGKAIPIHGDAATLGEIKRRFGYVLQPLRPGLDGVFYKPVLAPHRVEGRFEAAGMTILPFVQDHGFSETLGFRIGPMAYSTDVVGLDERAFAALDGVDTWIVDCFRREPHRTHSHLARTLEWIARVKPRHAILTHMDQTLDYETLRRELPEGVEPGYDGMELGM